jgi:hypothetical protein
LLKNQEQLINELKANFAKEMQDLKGQMSDQQKQFKEKLDRLYDEQHNDRQRKMDVEKELEQMKQEMAERQRVE